MIKTLICLSFLLLPLISAQEPIWRLVDASAPEIELIAKYAVGEHNKLSKESVVFVKVVKAKVQTLAATIYNLIIEAKNGDGEANNYEGVVITYLHDGESLISFEFADGDF